MKILLFCLILLICVSGCGPAAKDQVKKNIYNTESPRETPKEIETAVESVISAMSGQDVSKSDLRKLSRQIKNDKEAQTAVQAIKDSVMPEEVHILYCPVCGKRYSPKFKECPQCHVPLKDLNDE